MERRPKYLYRYMSFTCCRQQWVREIIVDSKLYFASRTQFNDPLDSTANVLFESSPERRTSVLRQIANKPTAIIDPRREFLARNADPSWFDDPTARAGMIQRLRRSVDGLGMVSLSSKCANSLLWSHYADKHQGVCLKFQTDVPGDTLFADARRIHYQSTLPVLNSLEDSIEDQIRALLLTKGNAWRYEGEWRLINTKRRGHDSFIPDCLVGVIFGWKMPAKQRRMILDWIDLRDQKISTYKCEPSDKNAFRLQVRRI